MVRPEIGVAKEVPTARKGKRLGEEFGEDGREVRTDRMSLYILSVVFEQRKCTNFKLVKVA